jgi:hypothetical protein
MYRHTISISSSCVGNNNYNTNNCYNYEGVSCGRGQVYAVITEDSNVFLGPVGLTGNFSPVTIGKISHYKSISLMDTNWPLC